MEVFLVLVINAAEEPEEKWGKVSLVRGRLLVPSRFPPLGLGCHRLVKTDWQDRGAGNEVQWAAETMPLSAVVGLTPFLHSWESSFPSCHFSA